MKCFALIVRRALILAVAISATALAQVPYPHPTTPPEARRHNYEHRVVVKRSLKTMPETKATAKRKARKKKNGSK
jgi:hypothetical protein